MKRTVGVKGKGDYRILCCGEGNREVLGAQMVGEEGVAHRIDTLAAALYSRMAVEDVARLDLAYAPPFASVWDPILIAASVALKKLEKGG